MNRIATKGISMLIIMLFTLSAHAQDDRPYRDNGPIKIDISYDTSSIELVLPGPKIEGLRKGVKHRFISTKVDSGYYYIPVNELYSDSVSGIVFSGYPMDKAIKAITIYWISDCTDGYYKITITPKQIYLHTSHDNPNPNFILWVYDVLPGVHENLTRRISDNSVGWERLNQYASMVYFDSGYHRDHDLLPTQWDDSTMNVFDNKCKLRIRQQVVKYMNELAYLNGGPIVRASSLTRQCPLRQIGYSAEVMELSLPQKKD